MNPLKFAVAGAGLAGWFAARRAALLGHKVTLFDLAKPGGPKASSRGGSRRVDLYGATALANAVQKQTVDMLVDLQRTSGRTFMTPRHILEVGPIDGPLKKTEAQIASANLKSSYLSGGDLADDYGYLTFPKGYVGRVVEEGGWLVEPEGVLGALELILGETITREFGVNITGIRSHPSGVVLTDSSGADRGSFDKVVIATGGGLGEFVRPFGVNLPFSLSVEQWVHLSVPAGTRIPTNAPIVRTNEIVRPGCSGYSLNPVTNDGGTLPIWKIMERSGGRDATWDQLPLPLDWPRIREMKDGPAKILSFLGGVADVWDAETCAFHILTDWLPVIDRLPGFEHQIVYTGGCSGAGFRKAPCLGDSAVQMLVGEPLGIDLSDWSATRFK